MSRKSILKKAQATAEYVAVVALIAAVLASMTVYMKRGIQGIVKDSVDEFGNQGGPLDSDKDRYVVNDYSSTQTEEDKIVTIFTGAYLRPIRVNDGTVTSTTDSYYESRQLVEKED